MKKNFKFSIHAWICFIALLLFAAFITYSFLYGERVWVNDGAGWDGSIYASFAESFHHKIIGKEISSYYLQHSFPSAVIYYITQLFHFKFTSTLEIIKAFLIYNYVLLLCSIFYLHKIAQHLKFTLKTRYLMYAAIVLTVPLLKKITYLPIGTDMTALFMGIVIFYYYLKQNYIVLFLVSVFAAFVYPSMIYVGFIILIVPNISVSSIEFKSNYQKIIKIVLVSAYVIFAFFLVKSGFQSGNNSQQINFKLEYVSLSVIAIYLYRLLLPISFSYKFSFPQWHKVAFHVILGVLFVSIIKFIIFKFSNSNPTPLKISFFFDSIMYGSIVNPLGSIVSHISYFGPFIFFIFLFWKKIYAEIQKFGLPILVFFCLYLFLTLGRESRQFINAWPFFVIISCVYLNKYDFSWRFIYMFVIMSIIFSKVWFSINVENMALKATNALEFPAQRFFMMNGAWMSHTMYYVHLIAEILSFGVFYIFLKKESIICN